ncbi:MAG TPA: response regulator [Polyangiales bacterium]|nr:response regulator [Polyangiales bacterium]
MPPMLDVQQERPSRLVDARAEFVATLGRRLEPLKEALSAVQEQPRSAARRDQLLRRLHAMGASARVLGFASVAEALLQAESALQAGSNADATQGGLAELSRSLELIPTLVAGASASIQPRIGSERTQAEAIVPAAVLVFGSTALASALQADAAQPLDVESSTSLEAALDLVRSAGLDAVVVDSDAADGHEFASALFDDPALLRTPVVVAGEFANAQRAAEYVARGAARVLVKPVSPETLQAAVLQALASKALRTETSAFGELDVEALTERISAEIRRGLVEATAPGARAAKVNLGSGSEVMAAVWGAVARVREVVTLRSGGTLRFAQTGPEGAIPVASWHTREAAAGPRGKAPARGEDQVSLQGRRIVVVDDDPAVAWFISGVLRTVGAEVLELHDGARALKVVRETWPDVVIADVLMPELDGFALCRELKRDVAVRDVPVILLSWKEDLLQRLREIGADADGYLRKEASASTVVQRVREVLAPRSRVEQRLREGGEVRGRLDGLTSRLVLELACAHGGDCRVSVRDAAYLYELQIRAGRPRCATRTSADGSFERGLAVLGPLLGVSAGRFVVTAESGPCRSDFDAPLEELLAEPIELARAAQRAFSEQRLLQVEAVEVDPIALEAYRVPGVAAVQTLIERLRSGASPRELLMSGVVAPGLLESLLLDLSRHGAVRAIERDGARMPLGADPPGDRFDPRKRAEYTTETPPPPAFTLLLSPAPEQVAERHPALGVLYESEAAPSVEPSAELSSVELGSADLMSVPVTAAPLSVEPLSVEPLGTESVASADLLSVEPLSAEPPAAEKENSVHSQSPAFESEQMDLADAVLGSLSDASSPPPEVEAESPLAALVGAASPPSPAPAEPESPAPPTPRSGQLLAAEAPIEAIETTGKSAESAAPSQALESAESPDEVPSTRPRAVAKDARATASVPVVEARATSPSSPLRIGLITLCAMGVSYGVMRYAVAPKLNGEQAQASSEGAATARGAEPTSASPTPATAEPSATSPEHANAAPPGASTVSAPTPQDLPLPPGVIIAQTKGLLEVDTSDKQAIYVDGVFVGRGPLRRIPLDPGAHPVELRDGNGNHEFSVEIKQGRRARVSLAADEKPGTPR